MTVAAARPGFEEELQAYRPELAAYCYRMLGSAFDADDAVQDTLVRAWRHVDRFEGRAALRSWLYRIATNVCLDAIAARGRRALPAAMGGPYPGDTPVGAAMPAHEWVEPVADAWVVNPGADPAERAVLRDSVRLAFVAALQVLPARQRAALILRDVLGWRPAEIAELLDTTVTSVNSALQRARASMAAADAARYDSLDDIPPGLLDRYVDAFERYDIEALVALLRDDAELTMPPFPQWFRGAGEIRRWMAATGPDCRDLRFVPLALSGSAGFGVYHRSAETGAYEAFAVEVLDVRDGAIAGIHAFLDPRLLTLFGLPATLALAV